MSVTIGAVWHRILLHEGSTFHTKTGLPFTYNVRGDALETARTPRLLHK